MGMLGKRDAGPVGPTDDAGGDFWRRRMAFWVALIVVLIAANVVFALLSPTGGGRDDASGTGGQETGQPAGESAVQEDVEEIGGMAFRGASRLSALSASSKAELPRVIGAWAALRGREAPGEVDVTEEATATQVGETVVLGVGGTRVTLVREASWKATDGQGTLEIADGAASATEAAHSSDAVSLDDASAMALVVGDAPVGSLADSWASWAEANGVDDPGAARAVVSSGAPSADGSTVSFTIECSGQTYQATLDAASGECSFAVGGEAQ